VRFQAFQDVTDPDEKRKEILWIAIFFIIILAVWLGVVLIWGYQPLVFGMSYDEAVMGIGLGVLIFCAVLYLAGREREQRLLNRRLFRELEETITLLDTRVSQLNGLCSTSAELSGSLDIDRIAVFAVDSLVGNMGADSASLVLLDEETGGPVYARDSHHRFLHGGWRPRPAGSLAGADRRKPGSHRQPGRANPRLERERLAPLRPPASQERACRGAGSKVRGWVRV
jgi:hypothetical protein